MAYKEEDTPVSPFSAYETSDGPVPHQKKDTANEPFFLIIEPTEPELYNHVSTHPLTGEPRVVPASPATFADQDSSLVPQRFPPLLSLNQVRGRRDRSTLRNEALPTNATAVKKRLGRPPKQVVAADSGSSSESEDSLDEKDMDATGSSDQKHTSGRSLGRKRVLSYDSNSEDDSLSVDVDSGLNSECTGGVEEVEEEDMLRRLLVRQQKDLDSCNLKLSGLSSGERKKVRNRKASRVSRLKKKLSAFDLQRRFDAECANHRLTKQLLQAAEERLHQLDPTFIPNLFVPPTPLSKRCRTQPAEQLYCLCRGPSQGNMIMCETCSEWFHLPCIQLSDVEMDRLSRSSHPYVCPRCETVP